MKTTLGQLISELFALYQERYHDEALARLATQVTINELLGGYARSTRIRRAMSAAGPRTRRNGPSTVAA